MPEGKKMFGEILIERGLVTPLQVDEALHHKQGKLSHRKLGRILVRLGHLSRETLQALVKEFDLEDDDDIVEEAKRTFPAFQATVNERGIEAVIFGEENLDRIAAKDSYDSINVCVNFLEPPFFKIKRSEPLESIIYQTIKYLLERLIEDFDNTSESKIGSNSYGRKKAIYDLKQKRAEQCKVLLEKLKGQEEHLYRYVVMSSFIAKDCPENKLDETFREYTAEHPGPQQLTAGQYRQLICAVADFLKPKQIRFFPPTETKKID